MPKSDDDPELGASVDSFRRAGVAVIEGCRTAYAWSRAWIDNRHALVQFVVVSTMWFVGNWTYNRIAPPVLRSGKAFFDWISPAFAVAPVLTFFEGTPVLASVQILMALIAVVVGQNRIQTQKLKELEQELTTMTTGPTEIADGGVREQPPTGGRAIGGAIAGGALGLSFGPGGVLAGIYLGFWLGDKLDRRAYERNPHTPDLNPKSKAEQ